VSASDSPEGMQDGEQAAGVRFLIRWRWWPTEHEDTTTLEGPYGSLDEAIAAAERRYRLIDEWHDASWEPVGVYPAGVFPPSMDAAPDAASQGVEPQ
jgi:hypothetical protein